MYTMSRALIMTIYCTLSANQDRDVSSMYMYNNKASQITGITFQVVTGYLTIRMSITHTLIMLFLIFPTCKVMEVAKRLFFIFEILIYMYLLIQIIRK